MSGEYINFDFRGKNLAGTTVRGRYIECNFDGCDLRAAHLVGTFLTCNFRGATMDGTTRFVGRFEDCEGMR